MNVEVSMPTGSLCSERAAIASALASDPSLNRSHFRAIAVLSASLPTSVTSRPSVTPSSTQETPQYVSQSQDPWLTAVTPLAQAAMAPLSLCSPAIVTTDLPASASASVSVSSSCCSTPTSTSSSAPPHPMLHMMLPPVSPDQSSGATAAPHNPSLPMGMQSPKSRGIASPISQERRASTILPRPSSVYRSLMPAKELNPLSPCGSCTLPNEIKKEKSQRLR